MEVKVLVDGVPRVVCGVTEATTCQEVVIALAQALGQSGRYTLREKFKDFERCLTPSECLLETLERYGEQAKDVQLTLTHNGPSVWDEMSRTKVGRYQPCPPLRRKDAGTRLWRGSSSPSLHRQSLPPLSCSRQETEQLKEDLKKPKRKSLTLMEEAWEWLESLGKGKVYSTTSEKESSKKANKRNRISLHVSVDKGNTGRSKSKLRIRETNLKSDLGTHTRGRESKRYNSQEGNAEDLMCSHSSTSEDEKNRLRETIIYQLSCLQDLQMRVEGIEGQIYELEEKQRANKAEEEAQQRKVEEEMEQIKFWENELKAEQGYEEDLQSQFVQMRAKAAECKAKLVEYKHKMQGFDSHGVQSIVHKDSNAVSNVGVKAAEVSSVSPKDQNVQQSDPDEDVNRKFLPKADKPPYALVPPHQMKARRPTGPTELREWWKRWSEAQSSPSHSKTKVIHRSELTIYLGSTKV